MSYSLVNSCIEIKHVEQGIPIDPYLLLDNHRATTSANKELFELSLA